MSGPQTTINPSPTPNDARLSIKSYIACDFTQDEKASDQATLDNNLPLMNRDRTLIYSHVDTCVHSNCAFTIFVKGKAGTGKSFQIKSLQALFTLSDTPFVTFASTGIAASLISGRTLHSVFGLYTDSNDQTLCSLDLGTPRGNAISPCRIIIVDEITMISRGVLDALDTALRRLAQQAAPTQCDLPFGSKSVILLGDLAQVPAVVRSRDDFSESAEQFFRSLPYHFFTRFTLSVVMRQDPNQQAFMDLLADVRPNDQLSPSSLALLRSRFFPGLLETRVADVDHFVGFDSPNGMVVAFRNERATYYNNLIFARTQQSANATITKLHAKFLVRHSPSSQCHPTQTPTTLLAQQRSILSTTLATDHQIRLLFAAFRLL